MTDNLSAVQWIPDGHYLHLANLTDDEVREIDKPALVLAGGAAPDGGHPEHAARELHRLPSNARWGDPSAGHSPEEIDRMDRSTWFVIKAPFYQDFLNDVDVRGLWVIVHRQTTHLYRPCRKLHLVCETVQPNISSRQGYCHGSCLRNNRANTGKRRRPPRFLFPSLCLIQRRTKLLVAHDVVIVLHGGGLDV